MEIILVLDNIRSTYNVGAILRTAEGLGVSAVICSGYTPMPVVGNATDVEYQRARRILPHLAEKTTTQISKTALGAERLVPCTWAGDILAKLNKLKTAGYQLVGLENNLTEARVYELAEPGLKKYLGDKVVLVLGEEVNGIAENVRAVLDAFITIPMKGQKESFNVSVATGIALWGLLGK